MLMASDQAQKPTYPLIEPQTKASREQLLTAAQALGDHIEELALHGQDDVTWIGLKSTIKEQCCSLVALGLDLYSGLPGITLFLAYLGTVSAEKSVICLPELVNRLRELGRDVNRGMSPFHKSSRSAGITLVRWG